MLTINTDSCYCIFFAEKSKIIIINNHYYMDMLALSQTDKSSTKNFMTCDPHTPNNLNCNND